MKLLVIDIIQYSKCCLINVASSQSYRLKLNRKCLLLNDWQVCIAVFLVAAEAVPGAYLPTVGLTQSKYQAQDELGQYSFGHQEPTQTRAETKDKYGIVRGSYRYTAFSLNELKSSQEYYCPDSVTRQLTAV